MKIVKNIIKSALTSWLSFGANILVGILTVPIMIKYLGDNIYGLWIVLNSILMYLNIMNFGMGSAIVKYVSETKGKGDITGTNKVISVIFYAYFYVALIIFFASILVIFLILPILYIGPTAGLNIQTIAIILVFNTCFAIVLSVFGGVLMGYQRHDIINLINFLNTLIRFILIVVFLTSGYGILSIAVITFISTISEGIFSYIYAKKIFPEMRIKYDFFNLIEIKKISSFSIYAFINVIMDKIIYETDYIVIKAFGAGSDVVNYSIPNRLISYFRRITSQFLGIISPTASELEARNEHQKIKKLTLKSIEYTYILVFISGLILFFWGSNLIEIWVGAKYVTYVSVLFVLLASHVLTLPLIINRMVLWGIAEIKIPTILTILEGLLNLSLSILLIGRLGILGVALGTAIAQFIFKGIALPYYANKKLKLNIIHNLWRKSIKFVLNIITISIILKFYILYIKISNVYVHTLIGILFSLLVSLLVVYKFYFKKKEQREIINFIKKVGLLAN